MRTTSNSQVSNAPPPPQPCVPLHFTLVELLVVIAIIGVLASMLLPALRSAKETGKGVACKSQVRQLAVCMTMYASDYEESLPYCPNNTLSDSYCRAPNLVPAYLGYEAYAARFSDDSIYRCPSYTRADTFFYVSYGYNLNFYFNGSRKLSSVAAPSETLLLLEKGWDDSQTSNYPWYATHFTEGTTNYLGALLGKRHNGAGNMAYLDSHVGNWRDRLPAETAPFWSEL